MSVESDLELQITAAIRRTGIPKHGDRFGMIGRLIPWKLLDGALEAGETIERAAQSVTDGQNILIVATNVRILVACHRPFTFSRSRLVTLYYEDVVGVSTKPGFVTGSLEIRAPEGTIHLDKMGNEAIGPMGSYIESMMRQRRLGHVAPSTSPDTKTCPRCAEDVKAAALVCRYCGFEFGPHPAG